MIVNEFWLTFGEIIIAMMLRNKYGTWFAIAGVIVLTFLSAFGDNTKNTSIEELASRLPESSERLVIQVLSKDNENQKNINTLQLKIRGITQP